jgi:importin subunit alpha-1
LGEPTPNLLSGGTGLTLFHPMTGLTLFHPMTGLTLFHPVTGLTLFHPMTHLTLFHPMTHLTLFHPMTRCCQLLETSQDKEVLTDACWAIQFLSCGSAERITAVLKAGIGRPLVEVFSLQDPELVLPAVQTICNVVGGSAAQTEHVIQLKALPALRSLLSHADSAIVRETCWTLSNIAAGTAAQVQALIDGGLITSVVNVATTGEYRSKVEACYVLANMLQSRQAAQALFTVDAGGLTALVGCLEILDPAPLQTFLRGISAALRVGAAAGRTIDEDLEELPHGLGAIEKLLEFHDPGVVALAQALLDEFFPEVSDPED